jgi:protein TonB
VIFPNTKQVLTALLLSLLIHALVFYAWPHIQTVTSRPLLIQGELVSIKAEEPPPPKVPTSQPPVKIKPESMPILRKAPEPRPQHKSPTPKKESDKGVALPLLTEKAEASSVGANNYVVPEVPATSSGDKLPTVSKASETPLGQYSPTSESTSDKDKTVAASANGDDQVDRAVLDEYGRGLRDRAAQLSGYPSLAKQRGWQGTVNVLVRFARNGVAYQISVKDSSGYKMLDDQAVKMVKQACARYVLPDALTHKAFSLVVPIEFKLI